MARKKQSSLASQLERLYERSGRNVDRFAARLGIDPTSAYKVLDNIAAERAPIKPGKWTEYIKDRLAGAGGFGVGEGEAEKIYQKEGPNYIIRDFDLGLGQSIPEQEEGEIQSFQIIIKGSEAGEEQYYTTHANQSLQGALTEMAALMRHYKNFSGSQIIVRTFIPSYE